MSVKFASISLLLILFLASPASAKTSAPAGSVLKSSSVIYVGGERYATDPVYVKVDQIYGLSLTPRDIQIKTRPGVPAYALCRLENHGNGTDSVTIHYEEASRDLRIRLIVDENNDGVRQKSETREVPRVLSLAENAAYNFFVMAAPSAASKRGSWTWAGVTATSSAGETAEYIGYNGIRYGGKRKVSAMVAAVVE